MDTLHSSRAEKVVPPRGTPAPHSHRARTPALPTPQTKVYKPIGNNKTKNASTSDRGTLSPEQSKGRPCKEHSFLTDVADVRHMEQSLLQLLDDFHSGQLQAFGKECSFDKMDQVREQQERLAKLHFELDNQQELRGFESAEAREADKKNMTRLMENLEELCTSIHSLQKSEDTSAPMSHSS